MDSAYYYVNKGVARRGTVNTSALQVGQDNGDDFDETGKIS